MKRILLTGALLALAACGRAAPSQDAPTTAASNAASVESMTVETPVSNAQSPDTPQEVEVLHAKEAQSVSAVTGQYNTQTRPLVEEPAPRTKSGVYTPRPGSAERTELMNAIREATRNDLGTPAVFIVHNLRSNGQWAFGQLDPQHPNGSPIRLESTPFYRANSGFPLDGLRIDVIWRKQGHRWQVYAHEIGATDVWYGGYCDRVPSPVIPGC